MAPATSTAVTAATLSALVPEGGRIALGDGAGVPRELWEPLVALLHERADIQLLTSWWFTAPEGTDRLPPGRVRTLISGFGMRRAIDAGQIGFVPVRFGTLPALLRGPLRPDVLLATLAPVRPEAGGAGGTGAYAFTTEVSWQRAAIAAGARVLAVVRPDAPVCDVQEPLEAGTVRVLAESGARPDVLASATPNEQQLAIADRVADLLPEGARVQIGPGGLGVAVYSALRRPVAVDTGLITDPVIGLDRRGLLLDSPVAPYVAGTEELYDWAPGRVRVSGVEVTHDPVRLLHGRPLYTVNTGIQIDLDGQVNAEVAGTSAAGGVGGQPDYAAAAATSPTGLSIFALPSHNAGRPTLVRQLAGPVTTPGHDVELVVTDRGVADLRGLSRPERRTALAHLWGSDAP
ncbi:MAG: putative acetyl-CoA hydrolase/transferase [Frankiales bacterium]|nr:putative acetyl-CoA hydrolase/transferase [Frankiales bacterium]